MTSGSRLSYSLNSLFNGKLERRDWEITDDETTLRFYREFLTASTDAGAFANSRDTVVIAANDNGRFALVKVAHAREIQIIFGLKSSAASGLAGPVKSELEIATSLLGEALGELSFLKLASPVERTANTQDLTAPGAAKLEWNTVRLSVSNQQLTIPEWHRIVAQIHLTMRTVLNLQPID